MSVLLTLSLSEGTSFQLRVFAAMSFCFIGEVGHIASIVRYSTFITTDTVKNHLSRPTWLNFECHNMYKTVSAYWFWCVRHLFFPLSFLDTAPKRFHASDLKLARASATSLQPCHSVHHSLTHLRRPPLCSAARSFEASGAQRMSDVHGPTVTALPSTPLYCGSKKKTLFFAQDT